MRRWAPVAAAAAVVIVAAGGVLAGRLAAGEPDEPAATALPSPADLVVADGDTVTGTGTVVLRPGGPARFCAPEPMAASDPPPPPACRTGLDLVNLDIARLTGVSSSGGVRWTGAQVTGRLSGTTLVVAAQGPAEVQEPDPLPFPTRTPCPPPAGGWSAEHPSEAGLAALRKLVQDDPAGFGEIVMTYPDGPPPSHDPGGGGGRTTAVLLTTVLDPRAAEARARAALGAGNLCVQRAARSRADVEGVWRLVGGDRPQDRVEWERRTIHGGSPDYYTGRIRLELLLLDEDTAGWVRQADPEGIVELRTILRPA